MDNRIVGQYKILEQIGSGSMGIVYRAEQLSLARIVAMKVLPPQFTSDPSFVQRFENEVHAIAALDHPNIVQIYDFGQDGQTYYYTMEFIDGTSLDNILLQHGALPVGQAIHIVARVAHALAYMHERGIIHRDIKPSNIMIDKVGTVKLMDFGLALYAKARRVTVNGGIVGTPEYMSPEQASGEAVTQLSDIYSLGVVLYELLTGNVPFEADTPLGVIKKIQTQQPVSPHVVNHNIPPGLEAIILRMMAQDPKKRYQNCHAIMKDLKHFRSGESVSTLASTAFTKRRLTATVAGILLVLALVGALVYSGTRRHEEPSGQTEIREHVETRGRPVLKGAAPAKRPEETGRYARTNKPDAKADRVAAATRASDVAPVVAPSSQSTLPEEFDPAVRIAKLKESLDSLETKLRAAEIGVKEPWFPDAIVFKTGEETTCQIVSEGPDKIVIRTPVGTAEIPREKVASLVCANSGEEKSESATRMEKMSPKHQIAELKESFISLEKQFDLTESDLQSTQFPDRVVFKTGEETECEIVSEASDSVKVRTPSGMIEIPRTQIKSLDRATPEEKENSPELQSELKEVQQQKDRLQSLAVGLEAVTEEAAKQKSDARRELDQLNIPFNTDELMSHAKSGDHHVVDLLLAAGMDVNTKDKLGKTALMYAADFGHAETAKSMLDKGADVNVKDIEGKTALMFAAARGHGDMAQILLDKGADANAKDDSGRTVLKMATEEGHNDIVMLLKKAGAKE